MSVAARQLASTCSGLVRATQRCHFAGHWHGANDVFAVCNLTLWSDDPYEAVQLSHESEEPVSIPTPPGVAPIIRRVGHYVAISVEVMPASLRGFGVS